MDILQLCLDGSALEEVVQCCLPYLSQHQPSKLQQVHTLFQSDVLTSEWLLDIVTDAHTILTHFVPQTWLSFSAWRGQCLQTSNSHSRRVLSFLRSVCWSNCPYLIIRGFPSKGNSSWTHLPNYNVLRARKSNWRSFTPQVQDSFFFFCVRCDDRAKSSGRWLLGSPPSAVVRQLAPRAWYFSVFWPKYCLQVWAGLKNVLRGLLLRATFTVGWISKT